MGRSRLGWRLPWRPCAPVPTSFFRSQDRALASVTKWRAINIQLTPNHEAENSVQERHLCITCVRSPLPVQKFIIGCMKYLPLSRYCYFCLFFRAYPHILWYGARFNQCLIFRQRRLGVEKCVVLGWQGDLMNRLIHRSWGEKFVDILLDLSIHSSHFSSSTCVCALGRTIQGPLCKASSPLGVRRR